MRERHPIDDLFKQGLMNAEAQPPSGILEGVLSRRSWSQRQLIRIRRRWPLLIVLLLSGGAATWYATSTSVPAETPAAFPTSNTSPSDEAVRTISPETTGPSEVPTERSAEANVATEEGVQAAAVHLAPAQTAHISEKSTPQGTSNDQARANADLERDVAERVAAREKPQQASHRDAVSPANGVADRPAGSSGTGDVSLATPALISAIGVSAHGGQRPLSSTDPVRMEPWKSLMTSDLSTSSPREVAPPADYVLPRGDWWIGLGAGIYAVERQWSGEDEELVAAWRESEGKKRDLLYGLYFGRSWRSGLWFGSGLEFGQGRSSFDHMEQRQDMTMAVTTQLAAFDEMVIAVVTDTSMVVEKHSETFTGTNRSSVYRVPVQAGWNWGLRRWELGVRAGLAGEWHTLREGYVLVTGANDTGVETLSAEDLSKKDRSYGLLSAQIGLSAGFHINEHLLLSAGPAYHTGLVQFSSNAPLQALPTRLGGLAQIVYILPSRTR